MQAVQRHISLERDSEHQTEGHPVLLIIEYRCLKLCCVNVSLCLLAPASSDVHGELEDCLKFPLNPRSKTTSCKPNKEHNMTHVEQFDCKSEQSLVTFGCKSLVCEPETGQKD